VGPLSRVRAGAPADAAAPPEDVLTGLDPDEQASDWGKYLADLPPDDRVWVIEAGSAVAGFARTGPCPDTDAPAGAGEVRRRA
jgi:hypothetical protein